MRSGTGTGISTAPGRPRIFRRLEGALLALIVLVYLALAAQYAIRTPDWQAPDEPAHVNYVRQIAEEHRLPVIEAGDWQQDYQNQLTATGFDPALLDRLDTVQYEDHQPPLYYLILAPVYALTDGDLLALRLVSVWLGAGVVIGTWAVIRSVFPERPPVALTGAGFVAFLPQHLSILASVNNDALAELVTALTLLGVVRYLGNMPPERHPVPPLSLGLLAGTAMLTKTTIYFLGGVVVLAVCLRWRRERWPWRVAARHLAAIILPALVMGGLWWGRNVIVYGGTDVFGLQRHDAVTVGQLRTADYIAIELGGSERLYIEHMLETTFHSFWGQFGWMAIPMPPGVYRALLVLSGGVLVGVFWLGGREGWPVTLRTPQRDALAVFAVVIALVGAAFLLYNREFVQFQGRYLYPALVPLAALVGLGLHGWTAPVEKWVKGGAWLPVGAMFVLAAFAWYALETYIVPHLPAW